MGVTALVMAGGRGTRIAPLKEKPLLKICGKPMIERVLEALKEAGEVDDVVVTVSEHTPETAKFMENFPVKVLETPGKGYVHDLKYAVRKLNLNTVLTISADIPLITSDVIDKIVERYRQCDKPALTVVVPIEIKESLGLSVEYVLNVGGKSLVPAGINVVDGRRIDDGELEEQIFIIDEEGVAVNVNTPIDLSVAERLLTKNSGGRNKVNG
ncbi:MAG: NTP transferase domain-containing protein [Candidatus Bathyarchaeia archaeon]